MQQQQLSLFEFPEDETRAVNLICSGKIEEAVKFVNEGSPPYVITQLVGKCIVRALDDLAMRVASLRDPPGLTINEMKALSIIKKQGLSRRSA